MSSPIAPISSGVTQQHEGRLNDAAQRQQQEERSFEKVLQKEDSDSQIGESPGISGAGLEKMRLDLMQRYNQLPPGASPASALLPEFIDGQNRLGLLRQAIKGIGHSPVVGSDLRGRFTQVESEWYEVERILKSDKDLSTGELLGLQARLYQVSQHVEVMSKVVDQMTGGIKTILNTNV